MPGLATIVIDGKTYCWRDLQRLRKEQLAAREAARTAGQPELLPGLPERRQPAQERTAEGRYYAARQSNLFPASETTPATRYSAPGSCIPAVPQTSVL